ncbi:MAG: hypothetical protein AABX54_01895 [Nanoarchaeota archaeon]
MANETLSQKVLFETSSEKTKGLPRFVKVPLVTLGILGAGLVTWLSLGNYTTHRLNRDFYEKQAQVQKERQEYVLKIAKDEQEKQSVMQQIVDNLSYGGLKESERKFIDNYRKEHSEKE